MTFDRKNMIAIVFSLCSVPMLGYCADLYKYKDDSGRWVFTDKKPKSSNVKKQRLMVTEARKKATIVNQGSRERPKLVALNPLAGPVQVWVEFHQTQNMRTTDPIPEQCVIAPQSELFLTALEKNQPQAGWSYRWQGHVVLGRPVARSQFDVAVLGLPFKGGPFVVSQSFHGKASHSSNPQVLYAVDIAMPKGTPIVAVKDGIVMDVESDFSRSGWSDKYADEANFVRLVHRDDSMTIYAHLDSDSILVGRGQSVKQGELLGYSGTTGYSTGPHLHFAWQINTGKLLESIPFEFTQGETPTTGMRLMAVGAKKRTSPSRGFSG